MEKYCYVCICYWRKKIAKCVFPIWKKIAKFLSTIEGKKLLSVYLLLDGKKLLSVYLLYEKKLLSVYFLYEKKIAKCVSTIGGKNC